MKVATRAEAAPPEPAPEPSALAFESPESTDDTESEKALADGAGGAFPGAARDSGSAFPGAMDE